MKVFIADKKNLYKYTLPSKIDECFLINYKGNNSPVDSIISVNSRDNKWVIKSNSSINLISNDIEQVEVELVDYKHYQLYVVGEKKNIDLYAMPSFDEEVYPIKVDSLNDITIGSDPENNISYKSPLMATTHAVIKNENDVWKIINKNVDDTSIYVNDTMVVNSPLKVGDIIFIHGLKIIWMQTFIKINNPDKLLTIKDMNAVVHPIVQDNSNITPVTDEESIVELYSDDDYFYHIPRMQEKEDDTEITIDNPPGNQQPEDIPLLLTLGSSITMLASSIMMGTSLYNSIANKGSTLTIVASSIMLVSMLIGSLLMPQLLRSYNKKRAKKRELLRQTKYKEYLNKKDIEIARKTKYQIDILHQNNITINDCVALINNKSRALWAREIMDKDFTNVRLGLGNKPTTIRIKAPEEHFTLDDDNLFTMVYEIVKKYETMNNVPIIYNFTDNRIASMIFNCSFQTEYINGILTQLISLQSGMDLKIVVLTNENNAHNYEYLKKVQHCWSDDYSTRFFATNNEELSEVSAYLDEVFKTRKEEFSSTEKTEDEKVDTKDKKDKKEKEKKFINYPPYYIIFTDDYKSVKNSQIIMDIVKSNENYGFTLVAIANNMKNLPNNCEEFIEIGEKDSCILNKEMSKQNQQIFNNEYEKELDMDLVSSKLANIPLMSKDAVTSLPQSISFLEMFNVSRIEQLNIINRWRQNSPVESLACTIGVHSNMEPFKLDLHEKFHGPHGLIAGSTGSGKSEFIITYILSMALNYHPYEVQFVLIDYKGGGLAGAFENKETHVKLPHLIGTITNLDIAEMNRTLVSIESELKRRQRVFNETRDSLGESTIDIYKYQKFFREGLVKEPMAHLFIISDEFAELKKQQPDFMDQLISTARIGRSLGVHLILATQKPSGVVNDQIWSNSKFKICLKVQDRSDSMEVLKKPDAASLKEAGRFYLQVGYDDYFDIGQSGWGGAKYIPSDKIMKKIDDSLIFINNVGHTIKSSTDYTIKDQNENNGDQLTNLVKYIANLSNKENIITKRLWLERMPGTIMVHNLKQKYNYKPQPFYINPVIGEYDDPQNQSQGLLNIDLTFKGNLSIVGLAGSGKENLLSTIIWSSIVEHTPNEVSFYIVDCGAETLKMFYNIPHVGEVATVDEEEKIYGIMNFINEELDRRKDLFSDFAGNYMNYCQNSGKKLPFVIVIINNYETFCESYSKLSDMIQPLFRECSKYGICFIISSISFLRGRMLQSFSNKIAMKISDSSDYRYYLGAPRGLEPSSLFGRGIVSKDETAYEFQTAMFADAKNMNSVIQGAALKLNEAYKVRAEKLTLIPDIVKVKELLPCVNGLTSIPLGYDINSKTIYSYNFLANRLNFILANNMSDKLDFIYALVQEMKTVSNTKVVVIDFVNGYAKKIAGVKYINDNFDGIFKAILDNTINDSTSNNTNVYLVIGTGTLRSKLSDEGKRIVNELFMKANSLQNSTFIFVDDYDNSKLLKVESWYQSQVDSTNGIWLAEGIDSQISFSTNTSTFDYRKSNFLNAGFVIEKSKIRLIKCVVTEELESDILDEK